MANQLMANQYTVNLLAFFLWGICERIRITGKNYQKTKQCSGIVTNEKSCSFNPDKGYELYLI